MKHISACVDKIPSVTIAFVGCVSVGCIMSKEFACETENQQFHFQIQKHISFFNVHKTTNGSTFKKHPRINDSAIIQNYSTI
jgi:hypothetical protein